MTERKRKIALFMSQSLIKDLSHAISETKNLEVGATSSDGCDAMKLIVQRDIDAVVLDVVLPNTDGIEIIKAINSMEVAPVVIVYTYIKSQPLIALLSQLNVAQILLQPMNADLVVKRISDFLDCSDAPILFKPTVRSNEITFGIKKNLDERIANIFLILGIPAHIRGYQYLREAVKIVINDPSTINGITKIIYPRTAEKFNTTPSKVERAIRHAIDVAFTRGKIENINSLFNVKVYDSDSRPTNGEFIALIADKLLMEVY